MRRALAVTGVVLAMVGLAAVMATGTIVLAIEGQS